MQIINIFEFTSPTVSLWADALGFNGNRNYLILVENNAQSGTQSASLKGYATLKINQGKVIDTNFNNNFLKNASPSASLSDLVSDAKIDGIITVDKIFMNKMLKLNQSARKSDLLTIGFLDLITTELKENHLVVVFSNKNEQSVMSVNGFSANSVNGK